MAAMVKTESNNEPHVQYLQGEYWDALEKEAHLNYELKRQQNFLFIAREEADVDLQNLAHERIKYYERELNRAIARVEHAFIHKRL